jgi:hypothetical protein
LKHEIRKEENSLLRVPEDGGEDAGDFVGFPVKGSEDFLERFRLNGFS